MQQWLGASRELGTMHFIPKASELGQVRLAIQGPCGAVCTTHAQACLKRAG